MFPILLLVTGIVLALSGFVAWSRHRDPFHPLIYITPLLFYTYVYRPGLLHSRDLLDRFFGPDQLAWVGLVNFLGVAVFCWGCLLVRLPRSARAQTRAWTIDLPPPARRAALTLGCWFGFIGLGAFLWATSNAGGLIKAYSRFKGGGWTPSGYIGEAQLLTLPAIVLLFLAWHGKRMHFARWALVLTFAFPNLVKGLLGTRRGPLFLILATLLFVTYLRSRGRQKPLRLLVGVSAIGFAVLFVFSHRRQIYIGADLEVDRGRLAETIAPTEISSGDEFVQSAGLMLTARRSQFHHWGKRYLTVVFIRPIPRQIWPTKYEDMGMGWIKQQSYLGGMTESDWLRVLGWRPVRGAAAGFIADLYFEFSYGALLPVFLFGLFFGTLWKRFRTRQDVWILLYIFAAVLSIYIPTQSFSAWLHRWLVMTVPTVLFWKRLVAPKRRQWLRQTFGSYPDPLRPDPRAKRPAPPHPRRP